MCVSTGVDEDTPVKGPWVIPVVWALVSNGADTHSGVFILDSDGAHNFVVLAPVSILLKSRHVTHYAVTVAEATFTVADVTAKPDFLSFGRGWSFFGSQASVDTDKSFLVAQATSDPDVINRYFAFRAVADAEKLATVNAIVSGAPVSIGSDYVNLFSKLLFDERITASTRALILTESESLQGNHPSLSFRYWDIAKAKTAMLKASRSVGLFVCIRAVAVMGLNAAPTPRRQCLMRMARRL